MALYSKMIVHNKLSKKEILKEAKKTNSMCLKKQAYSKKEALAVRRLRMNSGSERLRIYQCPICYEWHLTSQIIKKI